MLNGIRPRRGLHSTLTAGLVALLIAFGASTVPAAEGQPVPMSKVSHIHGLAPDPADPGRLFLATHHGLYLATPDGMARRISEREDDLMGFVPHPTEPQTFYASGHPPTGGNLGFIVSTDGGRTWEQRSPGARGPVDFHAMDVSKADPNVIYGTYAGLQVSRDGGKSWRIAGPAPEGVIDIAAGAKSPDTLYAATRTGLLISRDGGKAWTPAHMMRRPATAVDVAPDGTVRAYIVGIGLVAAPEGDASWQTLGRLPGDQAMLHLTAEGERLYAVDLDGIVIASTDGGRTWTPFAGAER